MNDYQICHCGLLKQKLAVIDGVETCTRCNRPADLPAISEADVAAAEKFRSWPGGRANHGVLMATTSEVPGRQILDYCGFVFAVGHFGHQDSGVGDRKRNEAERREQILVDALNQVAERAKLLGANAVVQLQVQSVAGNVGGATVGAAAGRGDDLSVMVVGTAVTVSNQSPTSGV